MTTAIIFGANGQDGHYLNALLTGMGMDVLGVSRSGEWLHTDIADFQAVEQLVATHRPNFIFDLAANSTTRHDAVLENNATIGTGTFNLLEAVYRHSRHTKVFLSGSGLQFENKGLPVKETNAFHASSPYAVSRIQSVYAGRYYRSLGLRVYFGYFYNHESPRRPAHHLTRRIAAAACQIAAGSTEVLTIGDVDVQKEWTFAGDVVKAALILTMQDEIFEANLGSGLAYSIANWLDACFSLKGLQWQNHVVSPPGFQPEYRILVSNPDLIHSLGWRPEVTFQMLAKMMTDAA